jgi:hypothetical protein
VATIFLEPKHRELLRAELGDQIEGIDIVSANAYLGAEPIASALAAGAEIVVCGRVADPSLALGPAHVASRLGHERLGSSSGAARWRATSSNAARR